MLIEKENLLMYFCFCRNNTNYHLVIESNVVIYSPARDMTAYLECVFVNKSKNSIIIDTTIFKNFTLFTCNHRWPLHLWKFEVSVVKDFFYILNPNEELVVFRASFNDLCFSNKFMWDWTAHPAPPKSPIYVSFSEKEEYLNETCLYFAYNIDGILVLLNILKLNIRK